MLALANVGDSRAYVFADGEMTQVTDDHSLAEERMRHGEMTEAEAAVHPQRHILTRALGVSDYVEADMWELELRTGDRLVLCSDGLTNEVDSDEMAGILGEVDDPEEAAQRLVEVANEHGGADNITVVVIDVQVGEEGDAGSGQGTAAAPRSPPGWPRRRRPSTAAVPVVGAGSRTRRRPGAEPEPAEGPGPTPTPAHGPNRAAHSAFADATGDRSGGRTGRDAGPRLPPRLRRRADDAGRDGTAQRRVLPGHDGLGAGGPFDDACPAAARQSGSRQAARKGEPRRPPAEARHPAPHHAAGRSASSSWWPPCRSPPTSSSSGTPTTTGSSPSQGEQIVVKQGQPGGVLWFHPKVVDRTGFTTNQIVPAAIPPLKAGVQRSSLKSAKQYVTSITTIPTTTTTTFGHHDDDLSDARRSVTPLAPTTTVPTTTTTDRRCDHDRARDHPDGRAMTDSSVPRRRRPPA